MTGQFEFHKWMYDRALPVWASTGLDTDGGGFVEHLGLDGKPTDVGFKRVRVQARQIYVYSHAAMRGHPSALVAARRGYEFLLAHGQLGNGLWARRLGRFGGVQDGVVDLYDQSFVILALAHYHLAASDPSALDLASATVRAIQRDGRHPSGLGFHDHWPEPPDTRSQNPHMHLLEATLALFEATGRPEHGTLADEMVELFHQRFFDVQTGTLGERFDADLRSVSDDVEPGHQMEWVWLLREYARLRGGDHTAAMARLYEFATTHGTDPKTGLLLDLVGRDGVVRDAGTRLWPQTEAVRAHLVMGRPAVARAALAALMARFLDPAPAGMWHDHFDAAGRLRSDKIPASSLYHLFTAFTELKVVQ